ncbi:MAG: DUF429 domain-containing protein [Gemmatimonadetes bacterium]|nr:DUF429 domain-containing protein [Gemmatimonadota bacterium]
MVALGVDGCEDGWLVVQSDGDALSVRIESTLADILAASPAGAVIAIDIPIGLPTSGARRCDVEARKLLGRIRGSSVFPAPVRATLGARTYADACTRHRRVDGRAISQQCYALLPKIEEVDATLLALPEPQRSVKEIHPEVSFAIWNGGIPMMDPKRTLRGRTARTAIIDQHWPTARRDAKAQLPRRGWAADDLNDALAAMWTAERIAAGTALCLPESPQVDEVGLRMEMA